MVRQISISVPHEKAAGIRDILQNQKIVHHLEVYTGATSTMIICKVVNKKTDDILQLLARYSVGIRFGHIDVIALTSTKPRIATFRGSNPKTKKYEVTDRMSYDEMVDFIDSSIHLTFDYLALIVVGAMICAGGLLTNSAVNVVASMLVSPLMGPIVGMTFGTIVRDKKMFWVSFRNECLGLFTCWVCGVCMGFLVGTFFDADAVDGPIGHNTEMSSRGTFSGLAWGAAVAIPSGLGVALGVSSYTVSALIGVAISAALLPPIVNSGVCLGASFIMYFVPSQSDVVIMNHWIKTGVVSLCLFICNWIILYLSALIMFRIKNLNYHANEDTKAEKLAHFSKLVDESSYGKLSNGDMNNMNNMTTRDRAITTQASSASIFSGGATNVGKSSANIAFETNIQSSTSVLRSGSGSAHNLNLKIPLLESTSTEVPFDTTQGSLMTVAKKESSHIMLQSGSAKAAFGQTYDFPSVNDGNRRMNREKSHSTSKLPGAKSPLMNEVERRLTQSADYPIVPTNDDITPLQLRKGSK